MLCHHYKVTLRRIYRVVSSRELNYVNIFLPRSRHLGVQSPESMMQTVTPQLSLYFEGLSEESKARYKEKISLINGNDPFGKVIGGEAFSGIVPVDACDLVSYLVLQTSFMTLEQFKARKGLEAYNQLVSGWIKDVSATKISEKYLTTGRVRCLDHD